MTTAQWVFEKAMNLMDEVSEATGAADTAETAQYKRRTLPILNVLRVECFPYSDTWQAQSGKRPVCPQIEAFDSAIALDDGLCQGVLPYGLAAQLLLDENPSLASYFQQWYEELLGEMKRGVAVCSEEICDLYGGIEYGEFARWQA